MQYHGNTLIVITGPTGAGKTDAAIALARQLQCHIVCADSRQIYRGIPIATAAPTDEQRAAACHHLVGFLDLHEGYSAARFETDALNTLNTLWQSSDTAILCGGSMLYIDAVCHGIDPLPDIDPTIREQVVQQLEREGLQNLVDELAVLDPEYCRTADLHNPRRVAHALEICRQTGGTYTALRTGRKQQRPFRIIKLCTILPRAELFERINRRTDQMVANGLQQEAEAVAPLRPLNSLNTVGLKEMFAYFDGVMDRQTAIERIKKNTRVYAKKQLTWHARDPLLVRCRPEQVGHMAMRLLAAEP